jgi:hypothetical protein
MRTCLLIVFAIVSLQELSLSHRLQWRGACCMAEKHQHGHNCCIVSAALMSSKSRLCGVAEQGYLPWGSFDVRYAAPETVANSLTCEDAPFSAAADFWSMGIVLYEAAAGVDYWLGYNALEIVQSLMCKTRLPHEVKSELLHQCGEARHPCLQLYAGYVRSSPSCVLAEIAAPAAKPKCVP